MKRKGRSAIRKQQDSCDVWLDPSALKRRKDVAAKPVFTLLGQDSRPAAVIGFPRPRTKQTTISTFFTAQKAGDKTTDPSKQLTTSASNNVVNLKDSEWRRGKKTRAPVLQPSSLQDCQRQPAKATDVSGLFFCSPLPARAQIHTSTPLVARKEDAVTERGAFLTTDLIQHLEEKGPLRQQLAAESPLREKNDGWQKEESPTLFSQRCPSFKIILNQRMDGGKRRRPPSSWASPTFVDDSENMDPELEGNLPEAAYLDFNLTGFCRRNMDATSCENSAPASTQRLFTQDSEGYRVILHRLGGEGSKPSLSKEPWWGKRTPVGSSFNEKSCFREGWAGDRSPPGSLGRRSLPPLTERSEKSCYDLLFTEDSEGNRVIKH
ncbi:PREDICTED: aurora kinase A and ninein-interacting protein [Thamnophis sirtalis]|uniref:Aurora kinase A and ninein-interacting protein n=1 Tax=Thamnophis sirtalis TaxID=35019 RepID=A0A6I9X8A2_9SAUR|nr:PREDICTED: aurora kinase A and ninein-interacting protein [Thamnophis sirtalis]XP_013910017.1 PREDICTED: aurora kinase A and ninein-interacting protein [Thamnophis sirtalis]XP_013910018.1 PREDICTED: aurora kinase A and ninein-interacting protein [Thamnophis sirtalis]